MAESNRMRGCKTGSGTYSRLRSIAFRLELLGLVAFAASQLLRLAVSQPESEGEGFFSDIPLAVLSTLLLLSWVGSGFAAGLALLKSPMESHIGRVAQQLAAVNVLLLPVAWALSWLLTPIGMGFSVGWGMPFFPVWAASGLGAICAGLWTPMDRRRGQLLIPLLLGAGLLTFFLGDMVPAP